MCIVLLWHCMHISVLYHTSGISRLLGTRWQLYIEMYCISELSKSIPCSGQLFRTARAWSQTVKTIGDSEDIVMITTITILPPQLIIAGWNSRPLTGGLSLCARTQIYFSNPPSMTSL